MQKYRSHKIVEAAELKDRKVLLGWQGNGSLSVTVDGKDYLIPANRIAPHTREEVEDGYMVVYSPNSYVSWSPRKAFEDGYAAIPPDAR